MLQLLKLAILDPVASKMYLPQSIKCARTAVPLKCTPSQIDCSSLHQTLLEVQSFYFVLLDQLVSEIVRSFHPFCHLLIYRLRLLFTVAA